MPNILKGIPSGIAAENDHAIITGGHNSTYVMEFKHPGARIVGSIVAQPGKEPEASVATSLSDLVTDFSAKREHTEKRKLIIDFGNADYLSAEATGPLQLIQKRLKQHGDSLVLANMNDQVRETFKITQLDRTFDLQADQTAEQIIRASIRSRH